VFSFLAAPGRLARLWCAPWLAAATMSSLWRAPDRSAARAVGLGANPVAGDIATPERWRQALPPLDGVIHLACDFDGTMADVDRRLLDALLPHLAAQPNQATFSYTGGCWLSAQPTTMSPANRRRFARYRRSPG
jgi:hypothetical protein